MMIASLPAINQIIYVPTSDKQFNEKDRLGYENAVACLVHPDYLDFPNEHGSEFIAKKLNKIAKKIYWELRAILYESAEHKQRIAALEEEYNTRSKATLFRDVTPFEQMCAIEDWFSRHTPLMTDCKFYLSSKVREDGHTIYKRIPAIFSKMNVPIYSLMQLVLGEGSKAPQYYNKIKDKKNTFEKQDPHQNQEQREFIYPLEALEIVRQPKFITSTLIKGTTFEAEIIDEDVRYGVFSEDGQIRPTACVEIKGQQSLTWKERLVKMRSAACVLFEVNRKFYEEGWEEKHTDICVNTDYKPIRNPDKYGVDVRVTPRAILQAVKDSLISEDKAEAENRLYQLIFKLFVVKIQVQSTPSLHDYTIRRLQSFRVDG